MASTEESLMEEDVPLNTGPVNEYGIPEYEPIELPQAPEHMDMFNTTGPRLMITHIVNENFKSYAGIQTLGPFHKSFSAIVGPNGSGKSNVIDSMLFVFGYRASKIRSKKLSVLIHNSEKHKNLNTCTVAVHFQKIVDTGPEDNDYDVVDGSGFVVSRTAFKDNTSYYRVNEKKVTYKEVATLLRSNGIDLDHNRFLILQGEVEQIAMMKPKAPTEHEDGMLEFLEDIIGSSRYKVPIEKLTQRVEELNELRGEKLNRVKAVEKEKDDLEGVRNEAVEFLTLENDIVKKKNVLYQKYIHELTGLEEKAIQKREQVKTSMDEYQTKMSELTNSKKAKSHEYNQVWKKYEQLVKDCEEKKEQFAKFEQQDVRCREDLKHAKAKAKKSEKTLEQEIKKLEELRMIPEKTEKDIADLKKKLEKLEAEKSKEDEKLKEVMDSLKTETQDLQVEKDGKESELLELQKVVNDAKSKYQVSHSELELYNSNQRKETSKLEEMKRNLAKIKDTLKNRKSAVKDLEKKVPETKQAFQKCTRDLEDAAAAEQKIVEEVRQTRVKVETVRSSNQAAQSRGSTLDALMQQKRSGRLPGIHGRLGDLGAIEEKYDVAISTACGPLDNILADNMDTAQKCVEFLRKNDIGTATFIGLDKMAKWRDYYKKKITTPENVPRLFDLIKASEEIRPAFYYALRDTLVAKDLEQATRIAYGKTRYRVVTLEGQLIDQSGTMSGGGGRVSRGRMGSKVVAEVDVRETEEMEKKLEKDVSEAKLCHEMKLKLEDTVQKMRKSLDELSHALDKFTMEIKSLTEQEDALEHQMEGQKDKVTAAAPDEKQLKNLEKTVAKLKKVFENEKDTASGVEDEVHRLHKQIMDIGGSKLKAVESRLNMIQIQIDQVTGFITKANVGVKTAERNAKKSETKVDSLKEDIAENAASLEKLEAELAELDENATKVLREHQGAQDSMKEMEKSVNEIKEAVAALEEDEQKLQEDHIDVKHEFERYENIVKENSQKLKHWKKELGRLSLHVIDTGSQETLEKVSDEDLESIKKDDLTYPMTLLEEKLGQMKPNMAAIAEYRKKEEAYLKRVSELDQVTSLRDDQRKLHEELRKQRLNAFMEGFSIITNKLKEMYQMITLGGDAELELVDSLDPFSEGIVFSVRPPKKSWKNISNLSGGEKTLSSLALVFALHHYKPTPLYVMDEIDAALDFKNVSIVANYIKERTKNAQFIIISLRNNMFELADRLIGIYKTYNCTKSATINPKKYTLPLTEGDPNVI